MLTKSDEILLDAVAEKPDPGSYPNHPHQKWHGTSSILYIFPARNLHFKGISIAMFDDTGG